MAKPLFTMDQTAFANLDELSPILDDAIVTKPLVNSDELKQILFTMDKGQELSEHCAPFAATVCMMSGKVQFTIHATHETREMVAGDWLIMKPDESHSVLALEPSRFLLTLVKSPGQA